MDAGTVWLLVVPNSAGCCYVFTQEMEAPGRSPDAITIRSVFSATQQKLQPTAAPKDQFVHDELLLKVGVLYTKSTANRNTSYIYIYITCLSCLCQKLAGWVLLVEPAKAMFFFCLCFLTQAILRWLQIAWILSTLQIHTKRTVTDCLFVRTLLVASCLE